MSDKYRILHLEDLPSDAELVARELKKSDIEFEQCVVDTEDTYLEALHEFNPDIILCDHSLPSFNSFEAIKIVKAKKLHIPFILITATMSEDVAMTVVREGADDYILKDRLKRLPNAVINNIEKYRFEKERKKLIDEAHDKEADSKGLLEKLSNKLLLATRNARIGIWEYSLSDNRFIADDVVLSIYGINSDDFDGSYAKWIDFVHAEDKERVQQYFHDVLQKDPLHDSEYRIVRTDGTVHFIKATAVV
ncbi:MAG TPA: PAS domain-containing protein, partial [Segetibacter sp.]